MPDEYFNSQILGIISLFGEEFGDTEWWPALPWEVMAGSVLTPQTKWRNVLKALDNLKSCGICTFEDISKAPDETIQECIRCTGFYRMKTERLKAFAEFYCEKSDISGYWEREDTATIRRDLLSIKGVGEETADSILCYALYRNSFVIDAYTERICSCAGIPLKKGKLKEAVEMVIPQDNSCYRKFHGWFVEYGKKYCNKEMCDICRIKNLKR
ncbi:endonuclease III domain-containing protein [Methanoplanus endosymbiosus]|uniref:Fe-S cluster assembly protein HesB n=1 Tax=Methanoplanus endosymbiosus TaxID=33865 RepID=A0A9E7PMH7_9EURY|nr:Fe-S cluster assembly protein HesB [Methanoplanus endosymbiosus]UUX92944.1 Fe-S cluster assembly protein HesB [Methanoplanus endosymbiosus]